jgi:hypothetical protein
MRTNEVYRLYQALDLVTIIKTQAEMARPCKRDGRSQPKRALQGIPGGGRRRGNPRKTWLDDVEDLSTTGAKRRMEAVDMTDWRKICEVAKFFKSCRAME